MFVPRQRCTDAGGDTDTPVEVGREEEWRQCETGIVTQRQKESQCAHQHVLWDLPRHSCLSCQLVLVIAPLIASKYTECAHPKITVPVHTHTHTQNRQRQRLELTKMSFWTLTGLSHLISIKAHPIMAASTWGRWHFGWKERGQPSHITNTSSSFFSFLQVQHTSSFFWFRCQDRLDTSTVYTVYRHTSPLSELELDQQEQNVLHY